MRKEKGEQVSLSEKQERQLALIKEAIAQAEKGGRHQPIIFRIRQILELETEV